MDIFKKQVIEAISEQVELDKETIENLIEVPPNKEMGDYAFPCFSLAKTLRKAPNIIAEDLSGKISCSDAIQRVQNVGGYVNFFVNKDKFAQTILQQVLEKGNSYGSSNQGKDKNIVIDYSALNIAKPFGLHHLYGTSIGNSLCKIYDFLGYKTIGINHIGDVGTQFGKLIVAYKKWGNKEDIERDPIHELVKIYVKFHEEAEKDPTLDDEGRAAFKAIEDGEEEYVELWKWFRDVSLKEFKRIYGVLNIEFDSWNGESFYSDKMDRVINELQDKGLLKESQGAKVVDLEEYGMPPCIVQRSDGASLYATRDLAAMFYRKDTYNFDKCLYVVATQQNLHFRQLFKVVELMEYDWAKDMIHVANGMISREEGSMSTRKGMVIYLEDVIKEAVEKVRNIIEERNPNLENKEEVAKMVGIGALKFSVLSINRIKDFIFTWEKILNFEGETAPYIQYTHARICSIFRKVGNENIENIEYSLLYDSDSADVITLLSRFGETIKDVAEKYEPSILARYLIDLSQGFNKFYHNNPVIGDNKELQNARLGLCKATRTVIATGMGLLGIECPQRM